MLASDWWLNFMLCGFSFLPQQNKILGVNAECYPNHLLWFSSEWSISSMPFALTSCKMCELTHGIRFCTVLCSVSINWFSHTISPWRISPLHTPARGTARIKADHTFCVSLQGQNGVAILVCHLLQGTCAILMLLNCPTIHLDISWQENCFELEFLAEGVKWLLI